MTSTTGQYPPHVRKHVLSILHGVLSQLGMIQGVYQRQVRGATLAATEVLPPWGRWGWHQPGVPVLAPCTLQCVQVRDLLAPLLGDWIPVLAGLLAEPLTRVSDRGVAGAGAAQAAGRHAAAARACPPRAMAHVLRRTGRLVVAAQAVEPASAGVPGVLLWQAAGRAHPRPAGALLAHVHGQRARALPGGGGSTTSESLAAPPG